MTTTKTLRRLFSRAAMTLALMLLTTMTAWAETVSVTYVNASGIEQPAVNATVLNGTDPVGEYNAVNLAAGTYVVDGDITYDHRLNFSGAATLILCDGATMSVGTSAARVNNHGIVSANNITIYGQSLGTGTLSVYNTVNGTLGISAEAITC